MIGGSLRSARTYFFRRKSRPGLIFRPVRPPCPPKFTSVYARICAFTRFYWRLLGIAWRWPRKRRLLARAWPPVLSPSARVSDKTRDGGVAERLKTHAWKGFTRETVTEIRIPPQAILNVAI